MPRGKVALLHYWLLHMRGGERVLAEFCRMFPEADIFTHAYMPAALVPEITNHRVIESRIAGLPGARRSCQKYLPLMPGALRQLDLHEYPLLISSESGPIKGVRKAPGALHICYCHTPMRYVWDMYPDYFAAAGLAGKVAMRLFRDYLRRYDLRSAEMVDHFVANSRFVADRIHRIYKREATVIHPPVDTVFFGNAKRGNGEYYLCAGQLNAYKRPDLAVSACMQMNRKLIVAGAGEELSELRRLAAGNSLIEFTGRVSDDQLRELYAGARALLFPGMEDFGIVPLEAQAAGCPVIAFGAGGALETVVPGETGFFFPEQSVASLCETLEDFEARKWPDASIRRHAAAFGTERFREEFMTFLNREESKR